MGDSANWPVPNSGLISMEQAAIAMLQRVLDAEAEGTRRVFALILGPVNTRASGEGVVTADQVGAAASASRSAGQVIPLHSDEEVDSILEHLAQG
jgi:3-oxoacyl-[acyl-carrier protein] reductase